MDLSKMKPIKSRTKYVKNKPKGIQSTLKLFGINWKKLGTKNVGFHSKEEDNDHN